MSSGVVYEIEGDLDFFKELKNMSLPNEDASRTSVSLNIEDNSINKCLITDERLRKDHITLKCGHKFNYIPLFKEVVFQKYSLLPKNVSSSIVTTYTKNTMPHIQSSTVSSSSAAVNTAFTSNTPSYGTQQSPNVITVLYNSSYNLETTKVEYNEIKCPYCRCITPHILPYYSYPDVSKIKYVNTPANIALPAMLCEYNNKSTKETICRTSCVYHEKYDMMLCNRHFNKTETDAASNTLPKTTRRKAKTTEINVDDENIIISHHNPATSVCSFLLLSGPRKGCPCGKPMWIPKISTSNIGSPALTNAVYCKTHYDKGTCQ
jgi:hypothetical protein